MMYGPLCTEFYDADKRFAAQEEVAFYKQILNKNELILEPMCGSGRLLIPLTQAGYTVHGCDRSAAMLKSCKERAASLGLQPILYEAAIEIMELPQKYDGIIIPLGSFQLFYPRSTAFQALENFRNHLKPGGKLVMDLFIPWDALYENNEEESSEREIQTPDGGTIKSKHHNKANKYQQFITSENTYIKILNDKVIAEEAEHMHICWYYGYEMELILEKYGFKNIRMQERFLNKENHMTFIAEK